MYADDYRVEVARGVALLDERKPGWRDLIDKDELIMINGSKCILGQIFADDVEDLWDSNGYQEGKRLLGLTEARTHHNDGMTAEEHGFMAHDDDYRIDRWDILTNAWLEVL